jgi:hypothetical protein
MLKQTTGLKKDSLFLALILFILLFFIIPLLTVYVAMNENILKSIYRVKMKNLTQIIENMSASVRKMKTPFGISAETLKFILPELYGQMEPIMSFLSNITKNLEFLPECMPYLSTFGSQLLFLLVLYIFEVNIKEIKYINRISILIVIMFLLFVLVMSTTYASIFHGSRMIALKFSFFITTIISIVSVYFLYRHPEDTAKVFGRFFFILFIIWYSLFWAGVLGLLGGLSLSLYPRYSEGYIAFSIPLEISLVSSAILSMTPCVLYLTRKKQDRAKSLSSILRDIVVGPFTYKWIMYWRAFYGQVITFGGGLTSDIMLLSFSLGIILTLVYSAIPFFYPFFVPSNTPIYKFPDISDIIQNTEVLMAAMLLWISPLIGLLILPERIIATSIGTKIRGIIMKNMEDTVIVVGGANRMVRPLLDKLIDIMANESDFILKEDAKLSRITEKLCIADYTGSLPDFSYEDPVLGNVGAIKLELQEEEILLVPCAFARGEDRVDNVKDILNKLRDVTGEDPKAIIVASRDVKIQHAIVEEVYMKRLKKKNKSDSDSDTCLITVVGAETSTDYRIYHKISRELITSNTNKGKVLFVEPYTENIAESILHRIFAFVGGKNEINITLIGYSVALGYLIRLISLAAYHIPGIEKININVLVYPDTKKLKGFIPFKTYIYKPVKCDISQFLRWSFGALKELKKEKVNITVYPLPSVPLHAILSTRYMLEGEDREKEKVKNIEKIKNILAGADLIVFLEDPKLGGGAAKIADYVMKILFEDERNEGGKPHILIAEGDLLSLGVPLRWIKERTGKKKEPIGIYIYSEVTDPFYLITYHLLVDKKENNILNAYFCINSDKLPEFLGLLEDAKESGRELMSPTSSSTSPRGLTSESDESVNQVEVILPKVYSCYYNPERRIAEAIICDSSKKSTEYLYACFDRDIPVSKVLSRSTVSTFLDKKEERYIDIKENKLKSSKGEVKHKRGIFFSCKKDTPIYFDKKDKACPNDFICPLAFLKEEEEIKGKYNILYMKARPCIATENEKRVLIELYALKGGEKKEKGGINVPSCDCEIGGNTKKEEKKREEERRRIIKELCPLISEEERNAKCKDKNAKERIYFKLYP